MPTTDQLYSLHYGEARTDANGKYRLTTLPAGSYDLSVEMPDWVNIGIEGFAAAGGKTQTAPDLVLTKGGVISIRVVDAKTGKTIELQPNMRADINSQEIPFRSGSRSAWNPIATADSEGRFELRTAPGKRGVFVLRVSLGDEPKWLAKPGPVGEAKPPAVVNVKEGETVQVDVPVVDVKELQKEAITLSLQIAPTPRQVIEQQTAVLDKDPKNIDALIMRTDAWGLLHDEHKAIADYERIIKLDPPYPKNIIVFNNLAYLLATSADDKLRDGKRAVELAEKAKQLEPTPTPDLLDTLAAAFAEAGDFDQAIETQKQAIDLATDGRREIFREPLKLYEGRQPRREIHSAAEQPSNNEGASSDQRVKAHIV